MILLSHISRPPFDMHIFGGKVDEIEDCVMFLTEELFFNIE